MSSLVLCWSYVPVHFLIGRCRISGLHFGLLSWSDPGWVLLLEGMPQSWIVLVTAYWFWLPLSSGDILRWQRRELCSLGDSKRRLRTMDVHRYLYGFWPFPLVFIRYHCCHWLWRSSKVIDYLVIWKPTLVINSNLGPISHRLATIHLLETDGRQTDHNPANSLIVT